MVLSHCGNGSFSLAEDFDAIELSPVRLMDQGCCSLFTSKPGIVTLLNIMSIGITISMLVRIDL